VNAAAATAMSGAVLSDVILTEGLLPPAGSRYVVLIEIPFQH
jgi:hypothetical protein